MYTYCKEGADKIYTSTYCTGGLIQYVYLLQRGLINICELTAQRGLIQYVYILHRGG